MPNQFVSSYVAAIVGLILTSLFWAGNIFVSKLLIGVIPPFTLNLFRWGIALLVLLPFVLPRIQEALPQVRSSWRSLSIFGFLGVTTYNAFLYTAAYTTSGLNIAVISTITPLLTIIFAWWFLRQKPNAKELLGFIFGLCGVLYLMSEGKIGFLMQLKFVEGDIWMLSACLFWAIYTVYLVKRPSNLSPVLFMFFTTVFGFLLALPVTVYELTITQTQLSISFEVLLALIYVGIFPSIASYLLFNYGVSVLGSQTASLCAYLIPVFTAIIGIVFLEEAIEVFHIGGQSLVFIGFCLALWGRNSDNHKERIS